MGEHVRFEVEAGIGRITLNRPEILNALHPPLVRELAEAVERAARDPGVWVVVVTGAGRAFSSGMDRNELSAGRVGEPFFRHWVRALNRLEDMDKLAVAAIRGHCLGGGLQLALACDFRLAAEDAILGLGATRHGLVPDGAVLRLARVVGVGRAKELALLNDEISAAEARAIGLVNWVAPPAEFGARLEKVLARCLEASPTATRHTKRLLHLSFHSDPRAMIEEVVTAQRECLVSPELEEANRAWDARRPARFFPSPSALRPPSANP